MEMVHSYSNFYNSYGNFNHQNDKPYLNQNYDNRPFKPTKSLDTKFQFPTNIFRNNNFKNNSNNELSSAAQENDKGDSIEFKQGMQDVPAWLKSLRLHKYKLIFSELTYEEMLSLTEQQLEEKNVTKGARHKIIVNIDKLRARQSNVIGMEKSIEHEGISGIRQSLNDLKAMLITPIKAFDSDKGGFNKYKEGKEEIVDGDLPGQIMSFLDRVYNCVQPDTMRDEEIIMLYLNNVDKCIGHEAFTAHQKSRLIKIKAKVETSKGINSYYNRNDRMNKMKWNNPQMNVNPFKNLSNNYHSGYNTNGFNNQVNQFQNSSTNFHHPYQNNPKFISSNYSSLNQPSHITSKNIHPKQNNTNLVAPNHQNNFNSQKMNYFMNKLDAQKFNSNSEQNPKNLQKPNAGKLSNENMRKLSENRYSANDNLNKFAEQFGEFDRQQTNNSGKQDNLNESTKILAPLSSCSLFNACSQIGKFTSKINNQLNSLDKFGNLESNCLKQNNQFIFNNLFDDSSLKCLENSSLTNSNILDPQALESKLCDDFDDDKLDENHQIYNHIELLSLRMTEHALGSSEFS